MALTTVLHTTDLDAMVAFLVERIGARVDSISPADDPSEVRLDLDGATVCVRRSDDDRSGHVIVTSDSVAEPTTLTAPNGTVVELRPVVSGLVIPESVPSLSLARAGGEFGVGRAGMAYRDLLPDRWGGRFIASHILIADGGDVPDYVHFHRIRFQMIFCARGWVDLVYEDQGEPFRLQTGDCVLQPPEIRHRVLRSSPGLEVIEIGCPATHDTMVEHDITLPTTRRDHGRLFSGQRFTRHTADTAPRSAYLVDGFIQRDTGIAAATDGLAGAVVVESCADGIDPFATLTHDDELVFDVILHGTATMHVDVGDGEKTYQLGSFDAVALPPGARWRWSNPSPDFEVLEVALASGAVVVI